MNEEHSRERQGAPDDQDLASLTRLLTGGSASFSLSGEVLRDIQLRIGRRTVDRSRVPKKVGAFAISRLLGSGGMGAVFLALHERTGVEVAVKMSFGREESELLGKEADGYARLSGSNFPVLLDRGGNAEFSWMALELIRGCDLKLAVAGLAGDGSESVFVDLDEAPAGTSRSTLRQTHVRTIIEWFRDMALALDKMHCAGMIHRDIKPQNIIISDDGTPYLIDFGLALDDRANDDEYRLAGTVPYMSPEQVTGTLVLSPQTDVFSLAVTFHEMLCGERVVGAGARAAMLEQIALGPPVQPPSAIDSSLPSTLDPVFMRALAKPRHERYDAARDLAEDLEAWLDGRPLIHARERRRTKVLRASRRWGVLAALIAALVVAVGLVLTRPDETEPGLDVVGERLAALAPRLDESRYQDVLNELSTLAPEMGDDIRFRTALRLAASKTQADRTRRLIERLTFAVGSSYESSTAAGIARLSRTLLPYCPDEPSLVAHVLLDVRIRVRLGDVRRLQDATEVLRKHRSLVDASALLSEVEAILLIDTGQEAELAGVLHRIEGLGEQSDLNVLGLRAFRLLRGSAGESDSPSLDLASGLVTTILDRDPHHLFALTIKALVAFNRGDVAGALGVFERTESTDSLDAQAGILAWRARCAAGLAAKQDADATRHLARSLSWTHAATRRFGSGLLDWLVRGLIRDRAGSVGWLVGVLRFDGVERWITAAFWELAQQVSTRCFEAEQPAEVTELALAAEPLADRVAGDAADHYHDLFRLALYAFIGEGARKEALELCEREIPRLDGRQSFEFAAQSGLIAFDLAAETNVADERDKLREKASHNLKAFLDAGYLEGQRRLLPTEHEAYFESLVKDAQSKLDALEGAKR